MYWLSGGKKCIAEVEVCLERDNNWSYQWAEMSYLQWTSVCISCV